MKCIKLFAAIISGMLAAGMAMPVSAYRAQLGDYQRIGSGLYLSETGAIAVDGEDMSGVAFGVQTKKENESQLIGAVRNVFRMYFDGAQYELIENGADTRIIGTEEAPMYEFCIVDKQQGDNCYANAARLYQMLSLAADSPYNTASLLGLEREVVQFTYYPCCGSVNSAFGLSYPCAEGDEMYCAIAAWLAEHAPEIQLTDDTWTADGYALHYADAARAEEPVPNAIYFAISDEFGYAPHACSTALGTFGSLLFATDFLAQRAEYDSITDEAVQAAIENYDIPENAVSLYLSLPESSIETLASRIGCSYDGGAPSPGMISEALAIGFAADIWQNSHVAGNDNVVIRNIVTEMHGYSIEVQPPQGRETLTQDDYGRILAYLEAHAGVPFGAEFEVPCIVQPETQLTAAGDMDGDSEVTLRDAVLLAKCAAGQDISLSAAGRIAGDLDENGAIEPADLTLLLRMLAGV